jgi:hypothetical protein
MRQGSHAALMTRNPERLQKLLRQNQLKQRAAELVSQWASHGISASPIAHGRYWKLIDRLRGGRSWPLEYVDDLGASVRTFGKCDLVTVIGWNVEDEPPLLVSTQALLRAMSKIESIYPDGFILINDENQTALIVDIDEEEGIHANRIDMPV